jgi:hypothetical protein
MKLIKKSLLLCYSIINKILYKLRLRLTYHPIGINSIKLDYLEQNKVENIRTFLLSIKISGNAYDLIRIGSKYDGGYLVPNDLKELNICYSLGVGNNSDFEDQLATKNIRSYLADYTVIGPASKNPKLHFTKKYIGTLNNGDTMRLETWIELNKSDDDMLLKMDIEGDEYNIIKDTPQRILIKFRILVIEFHNFELLGIENFFDIMSGAFSKIMTDFYIVHIHPNNCGGTVYFKDLLVPRVMEFTFLRKDRFLSSKSVTKIPHALDRKNCEDHVDILLPKELLA